MYVMQDMSSSSEHLPLPPTIHLASILDPRIGSRSVDLLGGLVSVSFTILSYTMENRLSLISSLRFRQFLGVSKTVSRPGSLVDIVIVVRRNTLAKGEVDLFDSKEGSVAVVKGRDVSVSLIGLAGVIFFF